MTKSIVIVGAGPAGLLTAINFLRRNGDQTTKKISSEPKYNITIVDPRQDYGTLSNEELQGSDRSWMIALSHFGLKALRAVPNLYERVSEMGVKLEGVTLQAFGKEIQTPPDDDNFQDGYLVDRNFIVSALAGYLNDTFGADEVVCVRLYHHRVQYVDGIHKRVLVRGTKEDDAAAAASERYISYDLLVGCDGIRSVVRGAFVQNHFDFDCTISDIFSRFKAVHVELPKSMHTKTMYVLPSALPKLVGIGLPEKGNVINLTFGYTCHDPVGESMASDDPKVIAEYLKKHLKGFDLVDYDDFAKQWANQAWNSTSQVHCNFYHSQKLLALIIGDAAHATSPSIGMGMNTALGDAEVLGRLLEELDDDLEAILPEFSKERVKEGNALTELSFNMMPLSKALLVKRLISVTIRTFFHRHFPSVVAKDPASMVTTKLSVVYERAVRMGFLGRHRIDNERLMRNHFEITTGMVTSRAKKHEYLFFILPAVVVGGAVVAAVL